MEHHVAGMKLVLAKQKRRLAELIELSGGLDPQHPLQEYSLRRISWLEEEIRRQYNEAVR